VANWKHRLDLSDFFHSDIHSLKDKTLKIKRRIEEAKWYNDANYNGELEQLLEELEDAGKEDNADHFDAVWDFLYDIFDAERVWVITQ
jgi:hypothetical protein